MIIPEAIYWVSRPRARCRLNIETLAGSGTLPYCITHQDNKRCIARAVEGWKAVLFRSTMATSMCFNVAFVVSKNPSEGVRRRLFTWFGASNPPPDGATESYLAPHGGNALQAVNPCGAIWVPVGSINGDDARYAEKGSESLHPSLFGIPLSPPFEIVPGCNGFHRMANVPENETRQDKSADSRRAHARVSRNHKLINIPRWQRRGR